jgi:hypothetical protein
MEPTSKTYYKQVAPPEPDNNFNKRSGFIGASCLYTYLLILPKVLKLPSLGAKAL